PLLMQDLVHSRIGESGEGNPNRAKIAYGGRQCVLGLAATRVCYAGRARRARTRSVDRRLRLFEERNKGATHDVAKMGSTTEEANHAESPHQRGMPPCRGMWIQYRATCL